MYILESSLGLSRSDFLYSNIVLIQHNSGSTEVLSRYSLLAQVLSTKLDKLLCKKKPLRDAYRRTQS